MINVLNSTDIIILTNFYYGSYSYYFFCLMKPSSKISEVSFVSNSITSLASQSPNGFAAFL